jgi:hypothetical protein
MRAPDAASRGFALSIQREAASCQKLQRFQTLPILLPELCFYSWLTRHSTDLFDAMIFSISDAQKAAVAVWAGGIAGSIVAMVPARVGSHLFSYGKLASARLPSVRKGVAFTSFYIFGLAASLVATWLLIDAAQLSTTASPNPFGAMGKSFVLNLQLGLDDFSASIPLVILLLYSLHLCRRIFECFFVHRHGTDARMPVHLWIAGLLHYACVPFTLIPMTALWFDASNDESATAGEKASTSAAAAASAVDTKGPSCSSGSAGGFGDDWTSLGSGFDSGGGFGALGGSGAGSCTAPPAAASAISTKATIDAFVSGPMASARANYPLLGSLSRWSFKASYWVFENRYALAAVGLCLFILANLFQHVAHRQLAALKKKEVPSPSTPAAAVVGTTAEKTGNSEEKKRQRGRSPTKRPKENSLESPMKALAGIKSTQDRYPVPPLSGTFRLCLAPHYFAEVLIYLSLLLLNADALVGAIGASVTFCDFAAGFLQVPAGAASSLLLTTPAAFVALLLQLLRPLAPLLLLVWVVANLTATALANKRWYLEREGGGVKARAAIFPGLL